MEKYYTPAIEEFHVGFEFEEEYVGSVRGMRTWVPTKFRGDYSTNYMYENLTKHKTPRCRVKFLDKEDIESLGFKHIGAGWFESKELDCRIRKWKGLEVDIYKNWSHLNVTEQNELKCFTGKIKNKSELKKLLKQLI